VKILFVCGGNTCRSPMAEVIFRNLCKRRGRKDIFVSSAGAAVEAGLPVIDDTYVALKSCGETIGRRKKSAVQFKPSMIYEYDLIITMTKFVKRFIGDFENVKTLDEVAGCGDILDPFGYPIDVYIEVCKKLQKSMEVLYNKT